MIMMIFSHIINVYLVMLISTSLLFSHADEIQSDEVSTSLRGSIVSKLEGCELQGNYCQTCTDCMYHKGWLICDCLISFSGSGGDDRPTESLTFPFFAAGCDGDIENDNGQLVCRSISINNHTA